MIVYGGRTEGAAEGDTLWVLTSASGTAGTPRWTALTGTGGPAGIQRASGAYDASTNRMIVHGGCTGDCTAASGETWVLTNANGLGGAPQWVQIASSAGVARMGHAAGYDAVNNRLLVFGGSFGTSGPDFDDVWVLTNANGLGGAATWERLGTLGSGPSPRFGMSGVYDPVANRFVVFGGRTAEGETFGDLWVLTHPNGLGGTPEWVPLAADGGPFRRWGHAAAFDPASRRLVVFGGTTAGLESGVNFVLSDAWLLSDANGVGTPTWVQLKPGSGPVGRFEAAAAYAPGTNRLIVTLGENNKLGSPRDLWVLTDATGSLPLFAGDLTTPTLVPQGLTEGETYHWKVVTRDSHGAWRGSPVWRFTSNRAPLVDAGPDQMIELPAGAQLSGTVSDDGLPTGSELGIGWNVVSGPGAVSFGDSSAAVTAATFSAPGTYVLRLSASDGALSAADEVVVVVNAPPNQAPVAGAGPDQTIAQPADTLTLNGAVADDGLPFGSSVTAAWTQVSGPAAATFADASAPVTTVTLPGVGEYVVRLTASDGEFSASDDVTVQLVRPNVPPTVSAGPDQAITLPANTVALAGAASDDGIPGGLSVAWSTLSGPGSVTFGDAAAASTSATFDQGGTYVLRLTATDGELTASDDTTIVVRERSDLVVRTVDASAAFFDGRTLDLSGAVSVEIRNVGTGPAVGSFAVAVFEDRNGNGTYEAADTLLGSGAQNGLEAGQSATLSVGVAGTLLFRDNVLHALVDSTGAILESDETNNLGSTLPACAPRPSGAYAPVSEWSWTTGASFADYNEVTVTPIVADLDGDGSPEVVFTSYRGFSGSTDAIVRAVSGRDGQELFAVTDATRRVSGAANLAVGDMDGDGRPEIVACQGNRLIAFEHDGTFKWQSPFLETGCNQGGPTLADLDGNGPPEIVVGRQALSADGTLRWTGTGGRSGSGLGPVSIVADLDLDGSPEVIAGNTAYRANGTIAWQNTSVGDGLNAVANFDADPFPEIVVVQGGRVWLLEHDGSVKWGPVTHPGGGGGAPTIADFDGDGQPEIGVAGATRYTVFETVGTIKWSSLTDDATSALTASSAFDLDGDGAAEVLYGDQRKLRAYRGADGAALFELPHNSCTAYENPVAADVDADGNVEILSVANTSCGFGARHGVFLWGDANDRWIAARGIWNQHAYHVTNVNDDTTIPAHEAASWENHNSYRQNAAPAGCAFAQPDFTATYVRRSQQGAQVGLTARIGNGGGIGVGPGVPVSYYDGDPAAGGRLLGTARTSHSLRSGGFEDVTLLVPATTSAYPLWVVADDRGGLVGAYAESDETNNAYDSGLDIVPVSNVAPSVDAGADEAVTLPGAASLAGQVTDDRLPSDTLIVRWSQVSGPGQAAFADAAAASTSATFDAAGTYVLRLTATDTALASSDDVTVIVYAANAAPTVVAPADASLMLPTNSLTLAGSVSDDGLPVGGTLTVAWSQVSGPAPVAFADAAAASTSVSFDSEGVYVLRLAASDGALSASDDVRVTVGTASSLPDLTVPSVDVSTVITDPSTLTVTGTATAAVNNAGLGGTGSGFDVRFFEDSDGDGAFSAGDTVLSSTSAGPIAGGQSANVSATVAGSVLFGGNLIYAFVDSQGAVDESDESNNQGSTASSCVFVPWTGPFNATLKWSWTGSPTLPGTKEVTSNPAVVDLDGDGLPEVVFPAFLSTNFFSDGHLRAIRGTDGTDVFTVTDPAYDLVAGSHIAVGDIDGDGRPEIVATADNGRLVAFEHDGTPKWTGDLVPSAGINLSAGPSIADLDGDGTPEIVYEARAYKNDGTLLWSKPNPRGMGFSIVADLDRDGMPEVIVGPEAYRADGAVYWQRPDLGQGYVAVANFDGDPEPEIAFVSGGKVSLLEHTGATKWGPVTMPDTGLGGPPTIADFDGDGAPEIGIANRSKYLVYESDGTLKWTAPTQDTSSHVTASSAFDFDGDGAAEIIYADEVFLRVFQGTDGVVLYQTPMGSITRAENPVVADVDGDGDAEIVAFGNQRNAHGVYVFEDPTGHWMRARKIWNQYAYHVTNVNDDGTIPRQEANSWDVHNGYRLGTSGASCPHDRPDLTASFLRVETTATERRLTLRLGNGGTRSAGTGIPVTLYDGEPRLGQSLGTVRAASLLPPGRFEDVTLVAPLDLATSGSVWVVADDRGDGLGTVAERDETNNAYDTGRGLAAVSGLPDLAVPSLSASVTLAGLEISGSATARVRNQGDAGSAAADVAFFEDRNGNASYDAGTDSLLGSGSAPALAAGTTAVVTAALSGSVLFKGSPVHAFVDAGDVVAESDEANNVGSAAPACDTRPSKDFSPRTEWSWTGSSVLPTHVSVTMTPAVVDLDGDGVADVVFVTSPPNTVLSDAVLRAVSGQNGRELFTVTTTAQRLRGASQVAVGDIDGDGRPEIVAVGAVGNLLLAFEHDGTFKWASATIEGPVYGGPALADLDHDGQPEIVVGRQVLNGNGTLRWTGTGGYGGSIGSPLLSVVADLDRDGTPEVVAGNTAYRTDGTIFWRNTSVSDGIVAVANMDDDAFPEVVVVLGGNAWLLEHTGAIKWGALSLGGGPPGSAPVVADFDGDGLAEIAASGRDHLFVIDPRTGGVRWNVAFQPTQTEATPAAFDFDGDGAAELVLQDATQVRILNGFDGSVLATAPLGSCTLRQGPVVADVDGDHRAELVVPVSGFCASPPAPGLHVLGDANDNWVSARPVWNQHSYHVANVEDDGTIPSPEDLPGEGWNTYRGNVRALGDALAGPDLTASLVRLTAQPAALLASARIGNAGTAPVAPGVAVSFYDGDPRAGGRLLGTAATSGALAPGSFEDVVLTLPAGTYGSNALWAVADDQGGLRGLHKECDESNNIEGSSLALNRAPSVDAGADQTTDLPADTVTLTGRSTDDGLPAGVALEPRWTKVAGPAPVVFGNPSALTTTATFTTAGTYLLRLVVTDTYLTSSDELTVVVAGPNTAPVVNAGGDQTIDHPQDTVSVAGSVSDDGLPRGAAATSTWSKASGPGSVTFTDAAALSTTARFDLPGTYVVRLTASDTALQASDDVTIVVTPPNEAPAVSAGPDRTISLPVDTTLLEGTVTDDSLPRNATVSVAWSVVSGPGGVTFTDATAVSTSARFATTGTYVLRLTASDTALSAADDVTVVVTPPNQAPSVNADADQSVVLPDVAVLSASVADDGLPVGSAVTLNWTKVDGPGQVAFANGTAATTSATFGAGGVYTLRLTANDGALSSSDDVVVTARANQAPLANAGSNQAITLPTRTVTLAGTVTDDGLPAGSTVTAAWSRVSGPGEAVFSEPTQTNTTATFDAAGVYVLRLTANDSALSGSADVSVTVNPAAPSGGLPVAVITAPADAGVVEGPVTITGTASSDTLLKWTLDYRPRNETTYVVLATSGSSVTAGTLGSFDPTLLLNGLYEIRLRTTDTSNRTATATTSVVVRGNQKVGHFSVSFVDLEVPVAGIPIRITRTYDSRDKGKGDFGIGWRLDVNSVRVQENTTLGLDWQGSSTGGLLPSYCLPASKPHVVTVTEPGGRVNEFEMVLSPQCQPFVPPDMVTVSFQPRPGTLGTLVPAGDPQVFVVSSWPGSAELYDSQTYALYDPAAYEYTSPDGRTFLVHEASGLQRVADLNSNVLTITSAGITHSSGTSVPFTRDSQGRITTIKDPEGRSLTYAYDANGDLVSHADRETNATSFTYETAFPHHLKEIKDPLGRTPIRNEYYPDGRIKSHTDAFGKTISYTRDISARQETVTDRTGKLRVLEYDARGNVIKETQPDGRIVTRTFDGRNNRLSETLPHDAADANPATTSYTYDAQENVTSVTDPKGGKTEYTYNARKQVLTTKDARGKLTTSVYDAKGNLTSTTDAANNVTSHTYDTKGNLLTQSVTLDGVVQTTSYAYDAAGNLTKETDANGHDTSYTYDLSGNRKTQTTTRTLADGSTETLLTRYEYDKNGKLTKTTDPDGTFARTVYDVFGRLLESHDKLGRKTSSTYDEMGRLVKTTYPDTTFEESTYDAEGRRLTSTDRAGRITRFEYDDLGRLTKTIYADDTFTESRYDTAGRLVQTIDARLMSTFFTYDEAGRRTSVKDPLNNETTFGYDPNGNQTSVKDPRQNTTSYEYDDLNRRTKTLFVDGTFTETTYDSVGRRSTETDQAGKTTRFEYDKLGRLKAVVDALDQRNEYAYDEQGNRTSQKDANGHETKFEYDKLGRQTARVLPDNARESRTYDVAGNLRTKTDFRGRTITYDYDANNRLLTKTLPDTSSVSYTYTATGRRQTMTASRGTTNYGYDVRDRLTSIQVPNGDKIDFAYDPNGNKVTMTVTAGGVTKTTGYTYDDASRLDHVVDPEGRTIDFDYDANGNRAALIYPNGTRTDYVYNPLNRLTSLTTLGPSGTVQSYAFTLGPAGNRERIDEQGSVSRIYGYDALYRLTSEQVTGGSLPYTKAFTYDPVGNRQNQTTTGTGAASIDYTYDTRDRLTSTVILSEAKNLTWDENGNLTSKDAEATYVWDAEDRLTRVTKTDGTIVTHAYDPDGNRIQTQTTTSGVTTTTNFLVDTSGALSHVVAETNATSTLQAVYVRGGDDLLEVQRPAGASTTSRFYHSDGIGSIRQLTDETGNVTDSYTYSVFGELLAHTGDDPQPYAFAGEPYDPNSGFSYNRARWMDPRVGRFTSVDPAAGVFTDPTSLHKYLYAHAEPVRRTDPSGLRSPIPLEVGRAAHRVISIYYGLLGAEIDRGPRSGSFLSGGLLGVLFGERWRTDIRFEADANIAGRVLFPRTKGEVYEIKSRKRIREGLQDVAYYLDKLATTRPEVAWRAGTDVQPFPTAYPGVLVHPSKANSVMRVRLEDSGLIVYWFEPLDYDEDDADQFLFGLVGVSAVISAAVAAGFAQIQGRISLGIAVGY